MKYLLRMTVLYAFALFLLPMVIHGVRIIGGIQTLLIGGFVLTLMMLFVKPILKLISFPLNIVTLGLFSTFTNVIILYLLTLFVSNIVISPYMFERVSLVGIIIPRFHVNTFFALVLAGFALSIIASFILWLIKT